MELPDKANIYDSKLTTVISEAGVIEFMGFYNSVLHSTAQPSTKNFQGILWHGSLTELQSDMGHCKSQSVDSNFPGFIPCFCVHKLYEWP